MEFNWMKKLKRSAQEADRIDPNIGIDIEGLLVSNGALDEYFYLQDIKKRRLFLNTDVDPSSVSEIVRLILEYNRDDMNIPIETRKPIHLYIASFGGGVYSGLELIDIILSSKTPVYTINLGYAYSMSFLIMLAGHKRFASRNATFLMHDGSILAHDSNMKLQDMMEFNRKTNDRIRTFVLSKSRVTGEEYDSKDRIEWYMFADEAKEKGFVDVIIGEDCDIDSVV